MLINNISINNTKILNLFLLNLIGFSRRQYVAAAHKKNCSSIASDHKCNSGFLSVISSKYPLSFQNRKLDIKVDPPKICFRICLYSSARRANQPNTKQKTSISNNAGNIRLMQRIEKSLIVKQPFAISFKIIVVIRQP